MLPIRSATKIVKKLWRDRSICFGVTIYMLKIGAMIGIRVQYGMNLEKSSIDFIVNYLSLILVNIKLRIICLFLSYPVNDLLSFCIFIVSVLPNFSKY